MDKNDDLEKLIREGFADMKRDIGGIREDMRGMQKEIENVKKTANNNSEKLADQATELAEVHDQMKDLIASDQDLRRRAGRRCLIQPNEFFFVFII